VTHRFLGRGRKKEDSARGATSSSSANREFAIFAHALNNSKPTAQGSIHSALRTSSANASRRGIAAGCSRGARRSAEAPTKASRTDGSAEVAPRRSSRQVAIGTSGPRLNRIRVAYAENIHTKHAQGSRMGLPLSPSHAHSETAQPPVLPAELATDISTLRSLGSGVLLTGLPNWGFRRS